MKNFGKKVTTLPAYGMFRSLLAIACLLLVIIALPARSQILTNDGFESGLIGWNMRLNSGGVASFANNAQNIHSGTNAILINVVNAGSASNSVQLVTSTFLADSNDTYVLRFWCSSSVLRADLGINFLKATPVYPQIPFEISTNNNGYQEYLYAFHASGEMSVAFNFQTVGQYWLDDVEILDLTNTDGWDIPMTYLWQWGQLNYSKTNSLGWGGGDNDKSVLLPDGSVAWIFNDTLTMVLTNTFYSNIRGDTSLPRNSVVHQVGTNLYWMNKTNATFFVPTNPANIYWIGGAVVETNKVLVLLNEINAKAITNVEMAVATMSLPSLALDDIVEIPSAGTDNYGAFLNGGDNFYYIYDGPKVARVPVGSLSVSSAWTFWNGSTWVADHTQAVGLPGLVNPWSILQLGPSNYASVYMPSLSLTIMAQFAPTPMGPWSLGVPLYTTAGQWGELNYAPNVCAGTGSNGVYTIAYSDDGSPENLAKWVSDKSFYNPHFIKANIWQASLYSLTNGTGGPGSRISLKFAADKNYNNDAINNLYGAGALNSLNWVNIFGINGGSQGTTNIAFYDCEGAKYPSRARLIYKWANEINSINTDSSVSNNIALLDSFINVDDNCWYLSVTNLDAPFTNGYSVFFYYSANVIGRGGQNYLRYYAGQTTNSPVLGLRQWNLFSTTNNNGTFVQDMAPSNNNASMETPGADYFVYTNLSGGAFDLLITNGNYGGVNAIEIVADDPPQLSAQSSTGSLILNWNRGILLQATNILGPWTTNAAIPPYTNLMSNSQEFYRLKIP